MGRVKLVYWALIAVLGSLAFFLIAAGARALLGRRGQGGRKDPRGG